MVRQTLVFISHTQEMRQQPEGESYVEGAEDAINSINGAKAQHMEFFPAADVSPAEYSVRQLSDADIFVGIVGFDQGSMVPGEARSYTELEFDAATELGKERLLFLLHPSAPGVSQADPGQVRFRQELEGSGATVAYFNDVGDLKYKVSRAVSQSIRERARSEPDAPEASIESTHEPSVSAARFTGLALLSFFLVLALGAWTAAVGVFPPWAGPVECSSISADVIDSSPATFGPFSSGATLDIVIENQSSSSVSVPAARDVIARGAGGKQHRPESGLADQSWFFGVEVQPDSAASVQLGLDGSGSSNDTVTVVIPGIRGADWILSRCQVTLDPVDVEFAVQ